MSAGTEQTSPLPCYKSPEGKWALHLHIYPYNITAVVSWKSEKPLATSVPTRVPINKKSCTLFFLTGLTGAVLPAEKTSNISCGAFSRQIQQLHTMLNILVRQTYACCTCNFGQDLLMRELFL